MYKMRRGSINYSTPTTVGNVKKVTFTRKKPNDNKSEFFRLRLNKQKKPPRYGPFYDGLSKAQDTGLRVNPLTAKRRTERDRGLSRPMLRNRKKDLTGIFSSNHV